MECRITKGLRIYQKDTYDNERNAMEQQAQIERNLKQTDFVTDMNRDIYALDAINEQAVSDEIENEEMSLGHLAEDDDYGEFDGDEGY